MLSSQAFTEKLGPAEAPYQAIETGNGKQYVYRVLRAFESPWAMRIPPNVDLVHSEMPVMLVMAIAHGNEEHEQSPFLHTTASLKKAIRIVQERKSLYSNWLTRWKKNCVEERVDFETGADRQKWLSENDNDSELVRQAVMTCRGYVQKDSEIVYMRHPGDRNIEWWDEKQKKSENSMKFHQPSRLRREARNRIEQCQKSAATSTLVS